MSSYMISLCVFCALLCYVHGATYFSRTCEDGKNQGDEWPFGECGRCRCYMSGMSCETCNLVVPRDGCTFVANTGAQYPYCCEGETVCPEK